MISRSTIAVASLVGLGLLVAPLPADAAVCVNKRTKLMALRDKCRKRELQIEALQFGAKGDPGDKGDQGDQGAQGDRGPRGAQGPGGSAAYSGSAAGSIVVQGISQRIARVEVPNPGKYVILAKAWILNNSTEHDAYVTCSLIAGTDTDVTSTRVERVGRDNATRGPLTFSLVHEFEPGAGRNVSLRCTVENALAAVEAHDIRITAVKVDDLRTLAVD